MRSAWLTPARIRILVLAGLVLSWEAAARLALVDPVFSSSPLRVGRALIEFLASDDWYRHVYVSVAEFVLGLGAATVAGVLLGLLMARSPGVSRTVDPFIMAMNSTPRTALVPLVVLWFGIDIPGKAVVAFLSALFPIVVTTATGARATDVVLLRMARSLMATGRETFVKVVLPGALPYVLDGIRQGVGRALIGVVVAEMYVSRAGLGHLLMDAAAALNTDDLIFLAVTISVLGFGLAVTIDGLERVLCPWRQQPR